MECDSGMMEASGPTAAKLRVRLSLLCPYTRAPHRVGAWPSSPTTAVEGWKGFSACKLLCLEAATSTATHQHHMNLCWTVARPHWPCKMGSGGNSDTRGM